MKFKKLISSAVFLAIVFLILNIWTIAKMIYPLEYESSINNYAKNYNLDPYLVAAVIKTESNFNVKAKSNKDAYGLMQITDSTAEWAAKEMKIENFSVDMLFDPEFNINMGCWYLNNLSEEFKGNAELILAAYNGGRGNVQKWLKDSNHSTDGENLHYIPFKETDKYVKKVKVHYNIYKYLYKESSEK